MREDRGLGEVHQRGGGRVRKPGRRRALLVSGTGQEFRGSKGPIIKMAFVPGPHFGPCQLRTARTKGRSY